jgi:hypothetical protein
MKETENKEFIDFLKVAFGQKEVGLIMAKNIDELSDFSRIMDNEGFKRSDNILDLLNSPKMYISVDENMNKNVYDFVVQYPTGQVEIFDNTAMKSNTFSPEHVSRCIVFLVLKEDLSKIQEKGWDILSLCGPTYQSQI